MFQRMAEWLDLRELLSAAKNHWRLWALNPVLMSYSTDLVTLAWGFLVVVVDLVSGAGGRGYLQQA